MVITLPPIWSGQGEVAEAAVVCRHGDLGTTITRALNSPSVTSITCRIVLNKRIKLEVRGLIPSRLPPSLGEVHVLALTRSKEKTGAMLAEEIGIGGPASFSFAHLAQFSLEAHFLVIGQMDRLAFRLTSPAPFLTKIS